MGEDVVAAVDSLGFDEYRFEGHDRGARVGYRFALDHPDRVEKLAFLDIVGTLETTELMDYRYVHGIYHWLFWPIPTRDRIG